MRTCICAKWYSQYSVCISYTLILVMDVYDNLVNKMVCLTSSHVVNRHCSPYSMASIFVILNGSCYIFLLFRKMFLKNVVSPKKCSWIFFFSEPWRQCTRRAPEWRPWRTARSSSWATIVAVASSTYTVTPLLALACNVPRKPMWWQCTRRAPEWRPWRTARSSSWAAIVAVASTYTVTPLLALACNVPRKPMWWQCTRRAPEWRPWRTARSSSWAAIVAVASTYTVTPLLALACNVPRKPMWWQCTRRAPVWRPWTTARSSSWAAIAECISTVTPLLALACNGACNVACSAGENLCDGNHQPRSRLLPTKKTQRSVAIIDKIDPFPRCTSVRMIATLQSQYND